MRRRRMWGQKGGEWRRRRALYLVRRRRALGADVDVRNVDARHVNVRDRVQAAAVAFLRRWRWRWSEGWRSASSPAMARGGGREGGVLCGAGVSNCWRGLTDLGVHRQRRFPRRLASPGNMADAVATRHRCEPGDHAQCAHEDEGGPHGGEGRASSGAQCASRSEVTEPILPMGPSIIWANNYLSRPE